MGAGRFEETPDPRQLSYPNEEDGAGPEPEPPLLRVALCRAEVGDMVVPGTENELAVLQGQPPAADVLGHEQSLVAQVSHPWGRWSWEGSAAFDLLRHHEVAELTHFLADIHAAIAAGQLDPLLDASQMSRLRRKRGTPPDASQRTGSLAGGA